MSPNLLGVIYMNAMDRSRPDQHKWIDLYMRLADFKGYKREYISAFYMEEE